MTILNYYLSKKNKMEVNKKAETYKRFIFNTILFIVFTLLTINNSIASERLVDLPTRVSKADYIFEGTVIHSQPYLKDRMIYTSNTVQITKILKGDLKCGTVEIITRGGSIEGHGTLEISNGLKLGKGSTGVFLCIESKYPLSDEDFYEETNHQKLITPFQNQSLIEYWFNNEEFEAFDYVSKYKTISLLHKELEKLTKLKFKKCKDEDIATIDKKNRKSK